MIGENPGSKISIFHYHLERGGVTQVIDLSVRALATHLTGLAKIQLVAGRENGIDDLLRGLKPICDQQRVALESAVLGGMDYMPMDTQPHSGWDAEVAALAGELMDTCGGSVWLVHNYHLGKNPRFTAALLKIAEMHPEQRLCFYIHDFPECARYENLNFLKSFISYSPYPISNNVRYAVINGRDLHYLVEAGIDRENIFLINNPVQKGRAAKDGSADFRKRLDRSFSGDFPAYRPDAPLMIYPVRTIRRKNILELGIIAAASATPFNLVVTLPGTSETELDYSKAVETAFTDGLIPGLWGIGSRLEENDLAFYELMAAADSIGASSIQEGFGYLFVDAIQSDTPLFARYLDVLDGIREVFVGHHAYFYSSFRVPADAAIRNNTRHGYKEKINRLRSMVDTSAAARIEGQIDKVVGGDDAEYSYLSLQDQVSLLERVATDASFAGEIRSMNPELSTSLSALFDKKPVSDTKDGPWPFSLDEYARSVQTMIESFSGQPDYSCPAGIQPALIERFAGIEYLRLIYSN